MKSHKRLVIGHLGAKGKRILISEEIPTFPLLERHGLEWSRDILVHQVPSQKRIKCLKTSQVAYFYPMVDHGLNEPLWAYFLIKK
jgi:hypothetical protein